MASILADTQYSFSLFLDTQDNHIELDNETIAKINYLAERVGAPTYKKTPDFERKHRGGYRKKTRSAPSTAEDWEAVRNFKTTKLERKTEGVSGELDKIRSHLNKLTKKTYPEIVKNIQDVLALILQNENAKENLVQIGKAIFEIGSKNKFWSELYAVLYKDLAAVCPIMKQICEENFNHFEKLFENIEYVDPNENYDEYCRINKINEERKGMSNFLTYLMKNNLITTDKMCKLIKNLLDTIIAEISNEGKQKNVEEISENLELLIVNGSNKLDKNEAWDSIEEQVEALSQMNAKEYPSLSQKTVFKMMDIYDEL